MNRKIMIIMAFLSYSNFLVAQKLQTENLYFDSVTTFQNKYVNDSILENIKLSKYDFEIRYYFSGITDNEGFIYIINQVNNKTYFESIDYRYAPFLSLKKYYPKYLIIGTLKSFKSSKYLYAFERLNRYFIDTPLSILNTNNIAEILNIKNQKNLYDSLTDSKIKFRNIYEGVSERSPSQTIYIEMKYRNRIRNFYISNGIDNEANPSLKILNKNSTLFLMLSTIKNLVYTGANSIKIIK